MDWEGGVGTGGYKLANFEPGVDIIVEQNPSYWKEGAAHFDSVEKLFIADATARTSGVMSGKIHSTASLDL